MAINFNDIIGGAAAGFEGYLAGVELARKHRMDAMKEQGLSDELEYLRQARPPMLEQLWANADLTKKQGNLTDVNIDAVRQDIAFREKRHPRELAYLDASIGAQEAAARKNQAEALVAEKTSQSTADATIAANKVAASINQAMLDFGIPSLMAEKDWITLQNAIDMNKGLSGLTDILVNNIKFKAMAENWTAAETIAKSQQMLEHVWTPGKNGEPSPGVQIWLAMQWRSVKAMDLDMAHKEALTKQANAIAESYERTKNPKIPAQLGDAFTSWNAMTPDVQSKFLAQVKESHETTRETLAEVKKKLAEAKEDLVANPNDPTKQETVRNLENQLKYLEGKLLSKQIIIDTLTNQSVERFMPNTAPQEFEIAGKQYQDNRYAVKLKFPNIGNAPRALGESIINFVIKNNLLDKSAREIELAFRNSPETSGVRNKYGLSALRKAFAQPSNKPTSVKPSIGSTREIKVYVPSYSPSFSTRTYIGEWNGKEFVIPTGERFDINGRKIKGK